MRIPFHRQPTDYECGPASLKMALAARAIRVPLRTLSKKLRTNPRTGTARGAMVKTARRLGLRVIVRPNGSLTDIDMALRQGLVPIVGYREPEQDVGHYAVVVNLDRRRITLHDPWHGPNFNLLRSDFLRRWYGRSRLKPRRWMMLVGMNEKRAR